MIAPHVVVIALFHKRKGILKGYKNYTGKHGVSKPQLFAEAILTDEIDIEKLAALKQRDATLWEKIKEFFTDLLDKLVGIIDA